MNTAAVLVASMVTVSRSSRSPADLAVERTGTTFQTAKRRACPCR